MRIPGRPELGHLTYCTNIHPAETWPDTRASLGRHLPTIRDRLAPGEPFGLGLRIAAAAAQSLSEDAAMAELTALLADQNCYVFTLNGFPYGSFHGSRVKEQVYAPDWSTPERLAYTNRLADILAKLLPDGLDGSISTVPGTFGAWADEARIAAITENLVRHAAHLNQVRGETGRTIALALEPEPRCFLETIDETARYFEGQLCGDAAVRQMAELSGLPRGAAADALRRHLGVCYDVCHAAVEFEDPQGSIALLRGKGIAIPKLQLSAAVKIDRVDADTARHLAPFDEPIYLHQVVAKNGGLKRYSDLPEALQDAAAAKGSEWRVHFHVPIFLERMQHFATTQDFLRDILALHRKQPISAHLEVETYTWDVLPERYRNVPVSEAIARELSWVTQQLQK